MKWLKVALVLFLVRVQSATDLGVIFVKMWARCTADFRQDILPSVFSEIFAIEKIIRLIINSMKCLLKLAPCVHVGQLMYSIKYSYFFPCGFHRLFFRLNLLWVNVLFLSWCLTSLFKDVSLLILLTFLCQFIIQPVWLLDICRVMYKAFTGGLLPLLYTY